MLDVKENRRAYNRRWYRDRIANDPAYNRRKYRLNRRRRLDYFRSALASVRAAIFDVLGRACVRCGYNDERALEIDHKAGGGARERRASSNALRYYRLVLAYVKQCGRAGRYQVLCANCNVLKRFANGEQC